MKGKKSSKKNEYIFWKSKVQPFAANIIISNSMYFYMN